MESEGKSKTMIFFIELMLGLESKNGLLRKRKFVGCSPLEHFEVGEKVGVGTFG